MKKINLIPGHYYIKLKNRKEPILAFYSGLNIAPWHGVKPYTCWKDIERVIN